jgi:hypothetical protein
MTADIDEAIDWQGNEIDCDACDNRALLGEGRCRKKHACVNDRYARRIDRFFDWNPALANAHLSHPHFEVRAIAAKSADVFLLPALLHDPDETVRWNAVRRLPRRYLLVLRNDPHREVRIRVASLLNDSDLIPMVRDADYYVRLTVARRIPQIALPSMMADEEAEVRRVVASRIDGDALLLMGADSDADVRLAVVRRLTPAGLIGFHRDPDWRVRYEAATRIMPGMLAEMLDDPDDLVREAVTKRIEMQASMEPGGNVVRLGRARANDLSQPSRRR